MNNVLYITKEQYEDLLDKKNIDRDTLYIITDTETGKNTHNTHIMIRKFGSKLPFDDNDHYLE